MVKTKIIETTEKFDKDGNMVERITREETTDDDTVYNPACPCMPFSPLWGGIEPMCNSEAGVKKAVR